MRRTKPYMEGCHDPEEKEPMEMLSRPSGLVVPKPPPEPPLSRRHGIMELRDPEAREKAAVALGLLWDALDLSSGPGLGREPKWKSRYLLYRFIGETLLGNDCPEKETLT